MLTFELPADRSAPRLARACLRAAASPQLDEQTGADLELLTSEVVSNAVEHAGMSSNDRILVRVETTDPIHVDVLDTGPGFRPLVRTPDSVSGRGWGLSLLDRLAKDWWVEREGPRTKVSFVFSSCG
jgi:anti-sigma regulatory factor (Ser/Thr protein kinase)